MSSNDTAPSPEELRRAVTLQVGLSAVFCAVIAVLRGGIDAPLPSWWLLALLVLVIAGTGYAAGRVPYTATPIDPAWSATAAHEASLTAFARQTFLRMAITGGGLAVVVLTSFAVEHAGWPIILGAPLGLAAMAWSTWPGLRNASITAAVLETAGARTGLVEAFS